MEPTIKDVVCSFSKELCLSSLAAEGQKAFEEGGRTGAPCAGEPTLRTEGFDMFLLAREACPVL